MPRLSGVGARVSSDGSYVRVDPDAVAAFARQGGGPVLADLSRRATNVQGGAYRQVGKDTWRLARSIVKRPGVDALGPFVDVVTEGVPYAVYHHDGTPRWHGNPFLTDNLRLAAR
jgi:hypothetical protein